MSHWSTRIKAASKVSALHLLFSAVLVAAAALLVFGLWYPYPYEHLLGGKKLFLILATVDLICGPLLTLVVFNPRKSLRELFIDISVIALVQLGALGYGLHAVAQARPVYLVFQVNDFRAVVAAEVNEPDLILAPKGLGVLPWLGPQVIGTRSPTDSADRANATEMALRGQEISTRPSWWQDYSLNRSQVLLSAKTMSELIRLHPSRRSAIEAAFTKISVPTTSLVWLPMVSRRESDWVVLLDASNAKVLGYLNIDGYELEPR